MYRQRQHQCEANVHEKNRVVAHPRVSPSHIKRSKRKQKENGKNRESNVKNRQSKCHHCNDTTEEHCELCGENDPQLQWFGGTPKLEQITPRSCKCIFDHGRLCIYESVHDLPWIMSEHVKKRIA